MESAKLQSKRLGSIAIFPWKNLNSLRTFFLTGNCHMPEVLPSLPRMATAAPSLAQCKARLEGALLRKKGCIPGSPFQCPTLGRRIQNWFSQMSALTTCFRRGHSLPCLLKLWHYARGSSMGRKKRGRAQLWNPAVRTLLWARHPGLMYLPCPAQQQRGVFFLYSVTVASKAAPVSVKHPLSFSPSRTKADIAWVETFPSCAKDQQR